VHSVHMRTIILRQSDESVNKWIVRGSQALYLLLLTHVPSAYVSAKKDVRPWCTRGSARVKLAPSPVSTLTVACIVPR
jgi:hypothetical protein